MALALSLPGMMGPSPSPSPSNLGGYAINPTPQRVAVQPANFNQNLVTGIADGIAEGMSRQTFTAVASGALQGLICPANYTVTASGSSTTKAYILNNDVANSAPAATTLTYSDGFGGALYNQNIPTFGGHLAYKAITCSVVLNAGGADTAGMAGMNAGIVCYNSDGSTRVINLPSDLNAEWYNSGILTWNFSEPIIVSRGLQLFYSPSSGSRFTFIFKHALV